MPGLTFVVRGVIIYNLVRRIKKELNLGHEPINSRKAAKAGKFNKNRATPSGNGNPMQAEVQTASLRWRYLEH